MAFDLANAVLDAPAAKWHKAAGVPGRAELTLEMIDDKPVAIPRFTVAAGDLVTGGALQFAARRVDFARDAAGYSRSAIRTLVGFDAEFKQGWTLVTVGGGTLDAEPWMGEDKTQTDAGRTRAAPDPTQQRPFTLKGQLAQSAPGRRPRADQCDDRGDPRSLLVGCGRVSRRHLPSGAPIVFDYRPSKAGQHALNI